MLDRNTFRELETMFAPTGTAFDRMSRHVDGLRILLQTLSGILGPVKYLWDNSFALKLSEADGVINGRTVRQWYQYSAAFLAFAVFMKTPLAVLASLSFELEDGTKVYPFQVFDPARLEDLAAMSLEQIAFSEPETELSYVPEENVDIVVPPVDTTDIVISN